MLRHFRLAPQKRFSSSSRITHIRRPIAPLATFSAIAFLLFFFLYPRRHLSNPAVPIRTEISPTSDPSFHCSVCRVPRPCLTSDHQLLATKEEMQIYQHFAQEKICEFQHEPDGRIYAFGEFSSKKTYVVEKQSLSTELQETYREEDILNLATYSPHLPFFVWTVYVRALFLQRICGMGASLARRRTGCSLSPNFHPTFMIPMRHQGLSWFSPLIQQTQARFPELLISDDTRSSDSTNEGRQTCYRNAIFTDCLNQRSPKRNEYFLQGEQRHPVAASDGLGKLSFLIISRKNTRRMKNPASVSTAVSALLSSHGVEHDVRTVFFEDVTFQDQQHLIRKSMIVIASHGAALGQMAYSPKNALIIDIFPFGYNFFAFQAYAPWSNVTYQISLAEPDFEIMSACLRRKKQYYEAWENLTKTSGKEYDDMRPRVSGIYGVRRCIRAQHLQANVTDVVDAVREWLPSLLAS